MREMPGRETRATAEPRSARARFAYLRLGQRRPNGIRTQRVIWSQRLQRHLKGAQDFIIGAICLRQKVERPFYQSRLEAGFGGGQSPDQRKLSLLPIIFRRRHRTRPLGRSPHSPQTQHEPKITRIRQSSNIEDHKLLKLLLANLVSAVAILRHKKNPKRQMLGVQSLPQCAGTQGRGAGGGCRPVSACYFATTFKRRVAQPQGALRGRLCGGFGGAELAAAVRALKQLRQLRYLHDEACTVPRRPRAAGLSVIVCQAAVVCYAEGNLCASQQSKGTRQIVRGLPQLSGRLPRGF
jgi:hypothetical protein